MCLPKRLMGALVLSTEPHFLYFRAKWLQEKVLERNTTEWWIFNKVRSSWIRMRSRRGSVGGSRFIATAVGGFKWLLESEIERVWLCKNIVLRWTDSAQECCNNQSFLWTKSFMTFWTRCGSNKNCVPFQLDFVLFERKEEYFWKGISFLNRHSHITLPTRVGSCSYCIANYRVQPNWRSQFIYT